ncbi:MAG: ArsI/CadI family heavy metal resistance metalloenzyme, partial [Vicinamibacteraceae bacterium]
DNTLRKFHASLNVSDLQRSIAFYRVLLGVQPAKVRPDYAKFDLAEPPLVLSLIPGRPGAGGSLNHLGLRVRGAEELVEIQRRLEVAGLPTEREEGVECCYARQTKFWITDPDRALWEIYVFHDDIDDRGSAAPPRAEQLQTNGAPLPVQVARVWEHRLQDTIPARIPYDDNTLHEVRLEGSINTAPDVGNRAGLLAESLRVLRPGATIHVHGLAGDRPSRSSPALAGPAAAVQHVPAVAEVVDDLAKAGFVGIHIERLSQTAYFVVDEVPMREVRVVACKPGHRPARLTHHAVYLGPMAQVTDDFGNVLRRGVPTPLNVHDWQTLSQSAASGAFLFLTPDDREVGRCCDEPPATTTTTTTTAASR